MVGVSCPVRARLCLKDKAVALPVRSGSHVTYPPVLVIGKECRRHKEIPVGPTSLIEDNPFSTERRVNVRNTLADGLTLLDGGFLKSLIV